MKPQFLIAAPHSGAGKTTVTLGILRALQHRGLTVQPYKCGPDYLDPKLHCVASGRQSINLDRFMMTAAHLAEIYTRNGADADVLVTEGVMGLFDGAVKMEGSSADIAQVLKLPVILIVNAKAMAYSAAALLLGFKSLCKDLELAGVIFNFVNHESHYRLLKEAAEDVGITPLGYLPPDPELTIPSRHLGLQTENDVRLEAVIEKASIEISKRIDLDKIMRLTLRPVLSCAAPITRPSEQPKRIVVAWDKAFNFIYPENITALSALGNITYFSPLLDTALPEADLVYLPGGYPEMYLETLSANQGMKNQLLRYYQNGGKILAECGGMMYLGNSIADENGSLFPMTGILPFSTTMQHKKLALGYKRISIYGRELLGHEFHYSSFTSMPDNDPRIQVWNARDEILQLPVFYDNNLLASYFHLYWGGNIDSIEQLLFS